MKVAILTFFLAFFCHGAISQDDIRSLEAAEIAGRDFEKRLRERGENDVPYAHLRNNIENYRIGVSFNRDYYFIYFGPEFEGYDVEGGAATYVLSRKDLSIVRVIPHR